MIGLCLLVLVNMFSVGKRYLNSESFTTPRQFNSYFNQRPVDKAILEDPAVSYRVADLSADMFNDTFNPYWHKSVGGYSPAKLQRYQDLIERYLVGEVQSIGSAVNDAGTLQEVQAALPEMKVLSALNTKYLIFGGEIPPIENPNAYGTAWFVDGFVDAATPDDEIGLIASTDLRTTAIVGADFRSLWFDKLTNRPVPAVPEPVEGVERPKDPADTIYMTSYSPNELHYHYIAASDRAAVFSEVYYPDWKAKVDGEDVDIFRADWIFRTVVLPAGEHDIVMRFEPEVYSVSEKASRASSGLMFALLVLALAGVFVGKKKDNQA